MQDVRCYDPCHEPFSRLPEEKFDGVLCTDVLEHCPEEDVPWILDEIFGYARRFVFANAACYPARKHLPNGENAHCTIREPAWWRERLCETSARHPGVLWEVWVQSLVKIYNGHRMVEQKLTIDSPSRQVRHDQRFHRLRPARGGGLQRARPQHQRTRFAAGQHHAADAVATQGHLYPRAAPLQSTDFSFTRFLVPYLSGYTDWSLFMDCDMLVLDDIARLWALRDDRYAVQVVKHNHVPKEDIKFLGATQTKYEKRTGRA